MENIGQYRFARVLPALVRRRMAALESAPPEVKAAIHEVAIKAFVDRQTGRSLNVGVTFMVVAPEVMPQLAAGMTQDMAQLPNSITLRVAGIALQVAGKQGLLWAASMSPAEDLFITLQGLNKPSVVNAARIIVAAIERSW